jgi:hypothetical protein
MRKLADKMKDDLPGMTAHMHLRDAATQMERGNTEGTFRHLYAATNALQPQALFRHGHLTDDVHAAAKQNMHLVHREVLKSRDIEDMENKNQENIARMRNGIAGTDAIAPAPEPSSAMNAPAHPPAGGPDPSVAGGPKPPPATTSQNHSSIGQLAIELVGPHGYEHGWIKVSDPSVPFGHDVRPGSFEHINAIQELADKAGMGPIGDPAHSSSVVSASLHNVARSVARRDIAQAKVHMKAAAWGNKHEAGGYWGKELAELSKQLDKVPAGATGFQNRRSTPGAATKRYQHPGTYVPTGDVPADPTKGATAQFVTATMANGRQGLELAEARDVHGRWIGAKVMLTVSGKRLNGKVKTHTPQMDRTKYDRLTIEAEDGKTYTRDISTVKYLGPGDVQLSAQTPALASTPHPFGKPGGPGLWGVKNMQLPPYIQNIAHALLRTGRAKDLSQAIAMARAATKRWLHGKNTSPEVRAASGASDADWKAKQAMAHSFSASPEDFREIYELATRLTPGEVAVELAAGGTGTAPPASSSSSSQQSSSSGSGSGSGSQQPRVPAGSAGGGQFGSAQGPGSGTSPANAKAQDKASLLAAAAADRKKARALLAQIAVLQAASKSATAKTASATKAGQTGKTASSAPAKVSTTSTAASSKTAPSSGSAATAAKPGSSSGKTGNAAKIIALRAQVKTLLAAAAEATAQAAKL